MTRSNRTLLRRFAEFDLANPEVWRLFERFTFDRILRRFSHYSADAILHRVRWETAVVTNDESGEFKINNDYSCCYARKFRDKHPNHADFFAVRISQVDGEWGTT